MGKSKKAKSQNQPAWGQGNSQRARQRRRLREAREAANSSCRLTPARASPRKRLKHSARQDQQQIPLDYGASITQRELLAEPLPPNLNPHAKMLEPSSKTNNPDVIDLTGDDNPIELPNETTYDLGRSNRRLAAGRLAGVFGNVKPADRATAPAFIDLDGSELSLSTSNEYLGTNWKTEPWSHALSPRFLSRGSKQKVSSYAPDKPMFSFGECNQLPLRFDVAAQKILGHSSFEQTQQGWQAQKTHETNNNEPSFVFGQAERSETRKSAHSVAAFGEPQTPAPGFLRVAWVRQDPETLANWSPRNETSLEDLYKEYPEKRLRSIEPDTLELVAKTIQQIAEEAANNWTKSSCPGRGWYNNAVNIGSFCHFDALSVQDVKNMVKTLLISSRAMIQSVETMTLVVLVRVIDQSIIICQMVKDDQRSALLQKAKEKVEWLPVGLDCKKLDIQRRAIGKLDEHRTKIRKELAQVNHAKQAKRIAEGDIQVLDWALVEFQEHRLIFVIEIFKTLVQLLEETA